jgi:hypothetical protein
MYYDTVTEILDDEGEGEREREEEMREGECITPLSASREGRRETWPCFLYCCLAEKIIIYVLNIHV